MTDHPAKRMRPTKPAAATKKARPVKKSRAAEGARADECVDPEGLLPGDTIEHSLSMEIRGPNGALWLKEGVTSVVRPDEDATEAQERVEAFVSGALHRKARAIIEGRA